jgi:hypothetical protein
LGNENRLFLKNEPNFYGRRAFCPYAQKKKQLLKTMKMVNVYADFAEKFMAVPDY